MVLLSGYTMQIKRAAACKPGYEPLYCLVHFNEDIHEILPYLNADLGAEGYSLDPPALLLRVNGRQIAVNQREIKISPVTDRRDAEEVMTWLTEKINTLWERRHEIRPCYEGTPVPKVYDVLRLLPRTNCGECGLTTCMVFASLLVQGKEMPENCPLLAAENHKRLQAYLAGFVKSQPGCMSDQKEGRRL